MPSHNSLTSLKSQLYIGSCYSLLSVLVRRNDTKIKHEELNEVKEKGEELRRGLGRGALSLPVPEGFFSLTLSFPVLLVPTTVEPLQLDTIYSRDTKFGPGKIFTSSLYLLPLLKGHLYLGERDTFVGSKAQVKLPFSRVPINAHVCVGCVFYNQKSKRTQASLSARVSETHKDIFATILEIPTCFMNSPFCLIGEYVPRTLFNVFQLARRNQHKRPLSRREKETDVDPQQFS